MEYWAVCHTCHSFLSSCYQIVLSLWLAFLWLAYAGDRLEMKMKEPNWRKMNPHGTWYGPPQGPEQYRPQSQVGYGGQYQPGSATYQGPGQSALPPGGKGMGGLSWTDGQHNSIGRGQTKVPAGFQSSCPESETEVRQRLLQFMKLENMQRSGAVGQNQPPSSSVSDYNHGMDVSGGGTGQDMNRESGTRSEESQPDSGAAFYTGVSAKTRRLVDRGESTNDYAKAKSLFELPITELDQHQQQQQSMYQSRKTDFRGSYQGSSDQRGSSSDGQGGQMQDRRQYGLFTGTTEHCRRSFSPERTSQPYDPFQPTEDRSSQSTGRYGQSAPGPGGSRSSFQDQNHPDGFNDQSRPHHDVPIGLERRAMMRNLGYQASLGPRMPGGSTAYDGGGGSRMSPASLSHRGSYPSPGQGDLDHKGGPRGMYPSQDQGHDQRGLFQGQYQQGDWDQRFQGQGQDQAGGPHSGQSQNQYVGGRVYERDEQPSYSRIHMQANEQHQYVPKADEPAWKQCNLCNMHFNSEQVRTL